MSYFRMIDFCGKGLPMVFSGKRSADCVTSWILLPAITTGLKSSPKSNSYPHLLASDQCANGIAFAMTTILSGVHQVTPAWLTELFHRKGLLGEGRVNAVQVIGSGATTVSQFFFLRVSYLAADSNAPKRLFLKIPTPAVPWANKEVEFYRLLAPEMQRVEADRHPLFPICYAVSYAPETNHSHLLLEELSATHFTDQGPMPPSRPLCALVVEAYARLHAFWWEHPWLGERAGERLSEAAIEGFLATARTRFTDFVGVAGHALNPEQHRVLTTVVSAWPARRRARVVAGRGVTLVHRDPHPLNFLYPYNTEKDIIKLIDWQSWRVDTGTDDLAYLMACHWPLAQESTLEQELLQHYHRHLASGGVQHYTWDDCWYDYRASIIRCLFFLMIAWSPAQWAKGVWWGRLQRALAAYDRWRCADLWAESGG